VWELTCTWSLPRQEEECRRITGEETGTVDRVDDDNSSHSTVQEDHEDDEGSAEVHVWQVTDVTEEDFETTKGETVDLYDKLMEMTGWIVTDEENQP